MTCLNDDKILLILDIDETLIYSTYDTLGVPIDFYVGDFNVYKRPFVDDFLRKVSKDFTLAIWSSATDDYVHKIVNQLIPQELSLAFVWGRSRCTYQRDMYSDGSFKDHYDYIKPLKKLKRKGYQLARMLIVDDSPHKCRDNYGNAIYPTPFYGESSDGELRLLVKYLQQLKDETNVRHIDKRYWQKRVKPQM